MRGFAKKNIRQENARTEEANEPDILNKDPFLFFEQKQTEEYLQSPFTTGDRG